MRLDGSNLAALARGCALLGGGGGGDPGLALIMAERAVADHGPVPVVALDELPPDGLVMPCGLIGSPTIAAEAIVSGDEAQVLSCAVEELHGAPVAALMPYEIAGANGLLPVTWAARAGLPLVDADGRGRAFPRLQQQAMHIAGVDASPVVLTDGRGNTLVVRAADDQWADRLVQSAAASMGGACSGALYCMTADRARAATVPGSLSLALELGAALATWEEPADAQAGLGAVELIQGVVAHIERHADAGFVRGWATIQHAARELRLELQNEYLLAVEDGVVRAAVPDIISVLAADTGVPVATEDLRHGALVTVLALAAPAVWRSADGLSVAGPAVFGYDVDYAPAGG